MSQLNIVDMVSKTQLTVVFDVVSTTIDPNKPIIYSTNYTPMYPYISRIVNMQPPAGSDPSYFRVDFYGLEFIFTRDQLGWYVTYQYSGEIFPIYTP